MCILLSLWKALSMLNKQARTEKWRSSILAGPWSMKLFYFGYFSTMGTYLPYLGLYLGSIHLSGTQIGLISSLFPLASMIMPPLWGMISDRYGWRKRLLITALLGALIASFLLWIIVPTFVMLLLFILVLAIVLSPVIPLADAITLQWISHHGGNYGMIRVYGSLGFLVSSIVLGSILNTVGIAALFLLLSFIFALPLLTSLFVPGQSKASMVRVKRHELMQLLRDRTLLLFLLFCMIGYGTFAAYYTFFNLYLRSLGVDTSGIGLISGLAIVSELPIMIFSGLLLKWLGAKWLLLAGLGVAVVRWLAYGLFTEYALLFAFTLLHGISFGCFYIASVTFIDQHVPAQLRTTGQTLLYGASFGLGIWISTNLFGLFYDWLPGGGMFIIAALVCLAAMLGLFLLIPRNPTSITIED